MVVGCDVDARRSLHFYQAGLCPAVIGCGGVHAFTCGRARVGVHVASIYAMKVSTQQVRLTWVGMWVLLNYGKFS